MSEIIYIDIETPDEGAMNRAVSLMKAGGVIAYPTETLYGLGADPMNEASLERLFAIKGRDFSNPIPLIIGDKACLYELVLQVPEIAHSLIEEFWPGPLTLIFHASDIVSSRLTAGTGKVGIRLSASPIARVLASRLSGAITATSANMSGDKGSISAEEVAASLGNRVDAIIDGGRTENGTGSMVLDLTEVPPVIIRGGSLEAAVMNCIGRQTAQGPCPRREI